jgi:Big-like domain-containing protein
MKKVFRCLSLLLTGGLLVSALSASAEAKPVLVSPSPASFGEIERLTLDNPADVYSGGVMVAGGVEMILPKNLLIDLPANRLSLQQIFDQAPAACKALGESGLAKADKCNATGSGGIATLSAVRTNAGNVVVGDLFIQKAAESVNGRISYINYDQGYYRVNGIDNDPTTGAMVRLNDPTSRHTIQSGAGCAGGPNCSPDPRFTLDPDNYTNTFATGYPVCIPSTVPRGFPGLPATSDLAAIPPGTAQAAANGTGDLLCPNTNRTPGVLNEPAVADSRRFAPPLVGDSVLAEGNYEVVNGVRFLSAHTTTVQKALATRNVPDQPDYLFLSEVGLEAPAFQNQRLVNLFIGFTTLAPTDVDIWSIHRDPLNNAIHEFPYASVQGCDNAGGIGTCSNQGLGNAGANIFKINLRSDFNTPVPNPKLSTCAHLLASRFAANPLYAGLCAGGSTHASNFGVMSPAPHEIIARTGHRINNPALDGKTIDINGAAATNGVYLFPLGLNLGGLGVAEMSEIDLNLLDTPITFEGIPWNLDRRLGPSGCLNNGGVCEQGAVGSTAFALDPFPFSGLDPRLQSPGLPTGSYSDPVFNTTGNPLTNIRNRMFSYVTTAGKFNGDATVLPYALGTFPADPPLVRPISPTPALNLYPPVTDEDAATTNKGVPAVVNVLANDVPVSGSIDAATVKVSTDPPTVSGTAVVLPSGATVQASPSGSVTYTPAPLFTGVDTFTYTVANDIGSVSLPGKVTITVLSTFSITSAAAPNGGISPAGVTPVLSNTSQTYTITPNTGFAVAALVVDGTLLPGATSYTFANVSADHYINAYFADETFTLTTSSGTNGAITPAGAVPALYGTASTFTITPDAGYQIASLVVDGVTLPAAASYTFTSITGNHTIGATFTNNFTISATAGANGAISPAGVTAVTGGGGQSFTVTPNAGFVVASLVVDGVTLPGATSYTFANVTANHTIAATFAPPPTITAAAAPNGAITPAGSSTVTYGSDQTYTITPNAGFVVTSLVVDGALLPGATSYTFTNVTANHYINAYFGSVPAATITAAAGPNGVISPAGAATVAGGASQTFTITPDAGFMVTALVVDGTQLPGAATYTFTNVTADHYINAYFGPVPATVTITAAAAPNGAISPAGANVVSGGTNQTYTITPDAGFTVTALVVDGAMLPGATSYTFTNVTTDHYINAYFGP